MGKAMLKKRSTVFKDFNEYWYYARYLTEYQRDVIYQSLPRDQQEQLTESYEKGEWSDVFFRNEIDEFIDDMKDRYGYNVLDMRAKILRGKSIYIPTKFWDIVVKEMNKYKIKDVQYILSGVKDIQCSANPDVTLLVSSASYMPDIDK